VQPKSSTIEGPAFNRAAGVLAALLLVALAVALVGGDVELMKRSMNTDGNSDLDAFQTLLTDLQGPANLALVTIVPLGLAVGGGMMALGSRKGVPVMVSSAGAGAFVILGNGLVA
jgi:hypothetical protein